jgi:AraC-like DNA-binding protein
MIAPGDPVAELAGSVVPRAVSLAFVVMALLESQRGARHDLVEPRRRLRRVVVSVVTLYAAVVVVVEIGLRGERAPPLLETLNLLMIIAAAATVAMLLVRRGSLIFALPAPRPSPSEPSELHRRLNAWLEEDGFMQPELSIRGLAGELKTQEHRLRKLLNQELGYQNFRDFLHQHRIREACRRLSGPAASEIAILNLSLDLGYSSLATFNRAFKAVVGMSPSEYRSKNTQV